MPTAKNRDMAELPILPLATDAFIADTTNMDAAETGAYLLMLMASWRTRDGGLPNDDKQLARIARCTPAKWQRVKLAVLPLWITGIDGLLRNPRLETMRESVRKRVSSSAKAARARWLKYNETRYAVACSTHMQPKPNKNLNQSLTDTARAREGFADLAAVLGELAKKRGSA